MTEIVKSILPEETVMSKIIYLEGIRLCSTVIYLGFTELRQNA